MADLIKASLHPTWEQRREGGASSLCWDLRRVIANFTITAAVSLRRNSLPRDSFHWLSLWIGPRSFYTWSLIVIPGPFADINVPTWKRQSLRGFEWSKNVPSKCTRVWQRADPAGFRPHHLSQIFRLLYPYFPSSLNYNYLITCMKTRVKAVLFFSGIHH